MADAFEKEDDAQLVRAILNGNSLAFKSLYFRYAQALFGYLWQRIHDRDTAEDLVQVLFARVWRKRESLDPGQSIRAYLYQAAHHLAIDHLRRKVRESEITEDHTWHGNNSQTDELGFERKTAVARAIHALPESQRRVFLLSRIEGLKYSEIATTLGLSVKTVETHMGRALKKLRESLSGWAPLVFLILGLGV